MNFDDLTIGQKISTLRVIVRQMDRHDIHPAVKKAIAATKRDNFDLFSVFLECPHSSKDGRLAYTRNLDEGERDICTIMDARAYVTARFADLSTGQIETIFPDSDSPTTETEVESNKPDESNEDLPQEIIDLIKAKAPGSTKVYVVQL